MQQQKLLFVYNAKSGLFNIVSDFAHKIISPQTYACDLCALTYGNFSMKQEWKTFLQSLPLAIGFMYKDTFVQRFNATAELPAIFIESANNLELLITKNEISRCKDVMQLKKLIEEYLQNWL